MQRFILSRLAQSFFTLWALSFVVFISVHLTGDPVLALLPLEDANDEGIQRLKEKLGLDKSKSGTIPDFHEERCPIGLRPVCQGVPPGYGSPG